MKIARYLLIALACILVGSQLLTDRIGFLQWVWWIPRVFLGVPLAIGAIVLWLGSPRGQRRRSGAFALAAVALALLSTRSDWGLPRPRPEGSVRVLFWNVCYAERSEALASVEFILSVDADVVVLTDPGLALSDGGRERLAARGYAVAQPGSFAIASRIPLLEATPLYEARHRALSRAVVQAPEGILVIDAVDLPSETTLHRYQAMRTFVAAIDGLRLGPADATVGDFNITRGSASLDLLVPGATEAFASAGVGWGGTYSRARPLLAIDQMLVAGRWTPARAEAVDPGFGRHRALVVDLTPAARR